MPNIGSVQVAGFYPFGLKETQFAARLINPLPAFQKVEDGYGSGSYGTYTFLDPCAGELEALCALAQDLFGTDLSRTGGPVVTLLACELEEERYRAALARAQTAYNRTGGITKSVLHGDAFCLRYSKRSGAYRTAPGVTLLWLNPPYTNGRDEERFLVRFTPALRTGGTLFFIVPASALDRCATYLAAHYERLWCFKVPGEYEQYHQVLLVATRRAEVPTGLLVLPDTGTSSLCQYWATFPDDLPILDEQVSPIVTLAPGEASGLAQFELAPLDFAEIDRLAHPWVAGTVPASAPLPLPVENQASQHTARSKSGLCPIKDSGLLHGLDGFFSQSYQVAHTLTPGHLTMVFTAGMFNACSLRPNAAHAHLPFIRIKGVFERELVTVEQRHDKNGAVTSEVAIQQPRLQVSVLRLDTFTYVSIAPGTTPSGARVLEDMNVADVLSAYAEGMAELMLSQFPPLHQAGTRMLRLPQSTRRLYRAQDNAVQTLLKLVLSGATRAPLLLAEVGVGKSTMALLLALCLSHAQQGEMRRQMRALGYSVVPVPEVRELLVFCPPHLLTSWLDEVKAVLPGASAITIQAVSDFSAVRAPNQELGEKGYTYTGSPGQPGDGLVVSILSRETAKLGTAQISGAWRLAASGALLCPGCGALLKHSAKELGEKRVCCPAVQVTPLNREARLLQELALLLAPLFQEPRIEALVGGQRHFWKASRKRCAQLERVAERVCRRFGIAKDEALAALRARAWQARITGEGQETARHTTPGGGTIGAVVQGLLDVSLDSLRSQDSSGATQALEVLALVLHGSRGLDGFLLPAIRRLDQESRVQDRGANGIGSEMRSVSLRLLFLLDDLERPEVDDLVDDLKGAGVHNADWAPFDRALARVRREIALVREGLPTPSPYKGATERDYFWNSYQITLVTGRLRIPCSGGSDKVKGHPDLLLAAFTKLAERAAFESQTCGEVLYQDSGKPRRYPLSRYIVKHLPKKYQFMVFDECHEMNSQDAAQSHAAHRLGGLPATKVLLSGSLMGGYASSLFANLQAFSDLFKAEFARDAKPDFVNRYGYRKVLRTKGDLKSGTVTTQKVGSTTDRAVEYDWQEKRLGEAPGVLPVFLPLHLLPISVFVHKQDLDEQLPSCREVPAPVRVERGDDLGQELLAEMKRLQDSLMERVMADMGSELAGKLLGALCQLPSYLDLCAEEVGNGVDRAGQRVFHLAYPEDCGGAVVASGRLFPADWRTPKERWLIGTLRRLLSEGHPVMVALTHTGKSGLAQRLMRLVKEDLGYTPVFLDTAKVGTGIRQKWISEQVVNKGVRVFFLNAEAAKTGLNNLIYFNKVIWYEATLSAYTNRQFNGRVHRIGQKNPVEIYNAYYAGTSQEIHTNLIAAKVKASKELDGLDLQSALEAAGAGAGGEDEAQARYLTTQSLGQTIFQSLRSTQSADRERISRAKPQTPASEVLTR